MGIEIEKKFLVDHEKWGELTKPEGTYFRQGYLVNEPQKTIRIRVTEKLGFITIKGITQGITRKEFDYQIPRKDGIELLDNFAVSELEKVRYRITFAGKLWEIDEFAGDNKGLIMAEIELQNETDEFTLPPWVTCEVSGDEKYYNSNLSVNPFKNWG